MKRFDPNYEAALELLPEGGHGLRYISVEVSDPDSWPFVAHRPLLRPDDVPDELVDDARARQRAQVAEALGVAVDGAHLRGYADPLMSGVIHSSTPCTACSTGWASRPATWSAATSGRAVESAAGTVSLLDGAAAWHFAQVLVPDIAWYRERYALHFDQTVIEMHFPAPYLNNQQTDLWVRRSAGCGWRPHMSGPDTRRRSCASWRDSTPHR